MSHLYWAMAPPIGVGCAAAHSLPSLGTVVLDQMGPWGREVAFSCMVGIA